MIKNPFKRTFLCQIRTFNFEYININVNNLHWIVLTNMNPTMEKSSDMFFEWGKSIQQDWYVYDSLNDPRNCQATSRILKLIYPEKNWEKVHLVEVEQQEGSNDCGLFCIAYVQMLAASKDPFKYKLDQSKLRANYNFFIQNAYLLDFDAEEIFNKQKSL